MTEPNDARHLELVSAAQRQWIDALTGLTRLFTGADIRAGYLATGLARRDEPFLEPTAPVLLRGLTITPTRARYDDFDLTLA